MKRLLFGVSNRKYLHFMTQIMLTSIQIFFNSFSQQTELKQVILEDSDVESKLNFSKPFALVIHGWLSGLLEGTNRVPNEKDGS